MTTLDELKRLASEDKLIGLYEVLEDIYHHAECPGLSQSTLKNLRISPKLCDYLRKNPIAQTPAMKFGSAAHTALLEPELFRKRFIAYPDLPEFEGQSKAAKEVRAEFARSHENKKIITQEDFAELGAMIESFYNHSLAPSLLKGLKEKTFFWKDELSGVLCKARPDSVNLEKKVIVDIKTTSDISNAGIQRSLVNYGYYLQAAHYRKGVNEYLKDKVEDFVFIFIETKAPYQIRIIRMDDQAMELGDLHLKDALLDYAHCEKIGRWKNPETVEELGLPAWFYAASDNDLGDDHGK